METTNFKPTPAIFFKTVELRSSNATECAVIVKKAIYEARVVKVSLGWHIDNLREFYEELTEQIGQCIRIGEDFTQGGIKTGEKWLEIRYDDNIPDLAAYRHSKNGQPLHTDESYISDPADIMLFYCVNKAEVGGNTTFIDGPVLVEHLKNYDIELFEKVTNQRIMFAKANDMRHEKIIDLSNYNSPTFNYNFYCIDKNESDENKKINESFFNYLQKQVASSNMIQKVGLLPGEAVLWWDNLVLHGRDSFKADKTNDRFIWKTGMKWK